MIKKILIVDDEIEFVAMLKIRLEANNYKVIAAFDGEEGLEKAKSEKPDLMILDVLMPKKDGWTLVREIKADQNLKHIPVIMLTIKEHLKDMFKLEGITDYITKPFKAEELLTKIKTCFSKERTGPGEN